MNIIILGTGRIGQAISLDLSSHPELNLTIVDQDEERVNRLQKKLGLKGIIADLAQEKDILDLVAGYDLVVNALPGKLGFRIMKAVIQAGIDEVDVSFFPENPLNLNSLAKSKNLKILTDCGLAPGLSNLMVGRAYAQLDKIESVKIYVGGLPKERKLPWEFYSFFSPEDIVQEYIRPARLKKDNQILVKPALEAIEHVYFRGIGTLEAFLTDGLRTLLYTLDIPNMEEKTLRYPGHREKIKFLQGLGLFGENEVVLVNQKVIPLDLTTKLLAQAWFADDGQADYTVMRIEVIGRREGQELKINYELIDEYDPDQKLSSMSRTTGFTTAACVLLLKEGLLSSTGVIPLEVIGQVDDCYSFILKYLKERNIVIHENIEEKST